MFKEFVDLRRKEVESDSPEFAGLLAQISLELLSCGQHATAEEFLRECLSIREKEQPDDWWTFNTKSMLGGALLGQQKYADAEPLLLNGYEEMKRREAAMPEQVKIRLQEALDRIIEFYTATEKTDEVQKWQAERAQYPSPAMPSTEMN